MRKRVKIIIRGAVQGVGFRPFIYKLAGELKIKGYVKNSTIGVIVEAEAPHDTLTDFITRINKEKPALAFISGMEYSFLELTCFENFEIKESGYDPLKSAFILPDIAVCDDCLKEMSDPGNRRYRYPFINCTNCGPRFSIIKSLPYDRQNTSMRGFKMCGECYGEYNDPADRRFHAQPIACPECGPKVELFSAAREKIARENDAVDQTIDLLREGKIIAVKGLGGYQLIVDVAHSEAVANLRFRKNREEKPFAVMFNSIDAVKEICEVSALEERVLLSPESPIVLLKKIYDGKKKLSALIAPDNPYLGVMLPYTPLHHLIMKKFQNPVVATSGNLAEEPICINEDEAFIKLGRIADYFLIHDRPIVRHVDDSIVRLFDDRQMILRRARGYAPFPVQIKNKRENSAPAIALGAHLKNTVAIGIDENIFVSQHIGDLSTASAYNAFEKSVNDLSSLYEKQAGIYINDMHPDYLSTKFAAGKNLNNHPVQHHLAHIVSCKTENQLEGKVLGIAWDGTGLGTDGNIWGSEFFIVDDESYSHIGQFRNFFLPGGESAVKEARRSLLGILYEIYGAALFNSYAKIIKDKFNEHELRVLQKIFEKKINIVRTSSAGRFFDAVSSLLNISHESNFEGQSAMKLEFAADENETAFYEFNINKEKIFIVDWQKTVEGIIDDLQSNENINIISARFHNTLAHIIVSFAAIAGEEKLVLSGGCFQNIFLIKRAVRWLTDSGFKVYTHQRIPTNDGGISLGQITAYKLKQKLLDIEQFQTANKFIEV